MNISGGNTSQDEANLVSLLKSGDKESLTLLYNKYSAAMYGIISRVISNEEVATETLQDVFLKIWDNFEKYDPNKGRLFTWMVQIARNTAIDKIRSGQFKRGNKTESMPDYVSNDERLSEEQRGRDVGLRKVVGMLDDQNQKIIELLYFHDYTQKEVSEELNMPLGTVKSRVRKAMNQLREILHKENLITSIAVIIVVEILIYYIGH